MQSKESLYPKDWFAKADNDLRAAEVLFKAQNIESASFHVQQVIEKYLKGYLLLKGWKLRRIHELDELLDEVIGYNPDFERFRSLCEVATEYYIEDRYPFMISSQLSDHEIKNAINETRELVKFITESL